MSFPFSRVGIALPRVNEALMEPQQAGFWLSRFS